MNDYKLAISEIEKNQLHSFYLLSGTEDFFINRIVGLLVNKIVNEESKNFDYFVLYGKEISADCWISKDKKMGVSSICIGGGEALSVLVERIK